MKYLTKKAERSKLKLYIFMFHFSFIVAKSTHFETLDLSHFLEKRQKNDRYFYLSDVFIKKI